MFGWVRKAVGLKLVADVVIGKLRGKKTILGALTLLFWFGIYAVPVLFPEYAYIVEPLKNIKEFLESYGLVIGDPMFELGAGVTVIGLMDKLQRFIATYGADKSIK